MRLLLDQNLSPRVIKSLAEHHAGSLHVRELGLARASDEEVWRYALDNALTIVSKDSDFHQRSLLFGHPPKVVWVQIGNCSTDDVVQLLHRRLPELLEFAEDADASFLSLE